MTRVNTSVRHSQTLSVEGRQVGCSEHGLQKDPGGTAALHTTRAGKQLGLEDKLTKYSVCNLTVCVWGGGGGGRGVELGWGAWLCQKCAMEPLIYTI